MGIVDVLDFMPDDHPMRKELIAIFERTSEAVVKYQDKKSGLWYQVMDKADSKENYLEASASSMFIYTMCKGVLNKYLNDEYKAVIEKAFKGLVSNLIEENSDESINLKNVCQVAGLGGNEKKRDGTFEYYMSEPIVKNDRKGTGSFILAALEYEKLFGSKKFRGE